MITISRQDQIDSMRIRLEERYELYTRQLTEVRSPELGAGLALLDPDRVAVLRRALADTAGALRAIAEDRYGHCEDCQDEIVIEWLEIKPEARFCVLCQHRRSIDPSAEGTLRMR